MGKTRVYELAQKLGLENKELLDKLQAAGIEAKSHMSVLDEADIKKLESAESTPAPVVEKVEEERITPGIIRRRRRDVRPARTAPQVTASEEVEEAEGRAEDLQEEPVAAAPERAEVKADAAVEVPAKGKEEESKEPAAAELPQEPQEAEVTKAPQKSPEPTSRKEETAGEVEKEAAPPKKAEPARAERPAAAKPKVAEPTGKAAEKAPRPAPPKQEKATASRARILGRVELPTAPPPRQEAPQPTRERPQRKEERPAGPRPPRPARPAAPAAGPAPTPGAVFPQDMPGKEPGREQRGKKGKKGKGGAGDYSAGEPGRRRGRRVEVFEPERTDRLRRGKRAAKPTKKTEITVSKAIKRVIRISDAITVGELAKRMGIKANDLIKELMRQGSMVTINHPLDFETAALLASDFNYEVENVAFDEESILEHARLNEGQEEKDENLEPRPPVVTIMGHVDHGKTSLLDAIRAANVTEGEAGGITQHIGAYDVELDGRKITFVDTPGHEAFTSMRARGAKVTDIVILVVAADDGVMPQTKEAINHAKAAEVPIIIAINKMDKPEANPDRVKQEMTEFELVPEEWGGDTIFVEVSAKMRQNLEQLLEMVLLQAEVMDLKANPVKKGKGTIVEARLDKGRGPVCTVLVQEGTLRVGDPIVAGVHQGRVRSMNDHTGAKVEEAGPSFPVEVTGLSGVPDAGDIMHAVDDEKVAKEVAMHRQQKLREAELAKTSKISLDQLYARIQEGDVKELKVIIKGDVQGSVEAVKESLVKLSTDACRLVVIHTAVGGITESDITLASASDAIVLGFNVRPESKAAALAESEGVDIRMYNIIYDAVADIKSAMEGLLAPTLREKNLGHAEVRETFGVSKVGTIAGCYILDGKIVRNAQARLVRDSVVIWTGKMNSLKRFKDDAREVQAGYECGIGLENYNDIKVGDIIEAFEIEEVKTSL